MEFIKIQKIFSCQFLSKNRSHKVTEKICKDVNVSRENKDSIQHSICVSTHSHHGFSFTTLFCCRSVSLSHTLNEPQEFFAVCFINLVNFKTPMNFIGAIVYDNYFIVLTWAFFLLTSIFQEDLWRENLCSCRMFQ